MQKQKGFAALVIILIVVGVVVVAAGGGVLVYQHYYPAPKPVACTMEAKLCPDGSSVGRTGPKCEFTACPTVEIITQPASLTSDKILNSNGFVNGKQGDINSMQGGSSISNIVFGDLDGDGSLEAIAKITSCGASCGNEVDAFKLVGNNVLTVMLPESGISGSAQNVDSMSINNGVAVVTETDSGGTRITNYQVRLVNGALKATKIVSTQPSITVTSPNGGEIYKKGDTAYIRWNAQNIGSTSKLDLDVIKTDGTVYFNIGTLVNPLIGSQVDASGPAWSWWVPADNGPGGQRIDPGQYKVRISITGQPSIYDMSDNYFTIVAP